MGLGFVYEITPRCNQDCIFCYNVWKETGAAEMREARPQEIRQIMDAVLRHPEAEWITFAGGEPLLSDQLLPSIHYVKNTYPRIRVGVASNGQLADMTILQRLRDAGVWTMEFPLHTHDRARYREWTGGSLTRVREAIAEAVALGIQVTVSITVTAKTQDNLRETVELALLLGADRIAFNRFIPTGMGKNNVADLALSSVRLRALLEEANRIAQALNVRIDVSIPVQPCEIPHEQFPALQFVACVCGKEKWAISPDGTLRTCEQNNKSLGSLLRNSAEELMRSPAVQTFRAANRSAACVDCTRYASCGGACRFADIPASV